MGYLYAFATPSMHGIVKIGATTRDVSERLCEANASHTWCTPEPYALVCCVEVEDPFAVEHRVHAAICARRVNPRREFFHATPDEVSALFGMLVPLQNAPTGAAPASVQCRFLKKNGNAGVYPGPRCAVRRLARADVP